MSRIFKKIKFSNPDRYKWFVAIFVSCINLMGQQTYFQQEVNYKIDVALNDVSHSLKGFEQIQYINNSSNSIDFIYFHLWPNAYKNNQTALAKQFLQLGKTDFYFSTEQERGFIDSLSFLAKGKALKMEYDPENPDICKIILNEPLRSLDTLDISTPFYVKIPDSKFSRLGHNEQAYFITQWYPKPAVYDRDGWHPMPYLDQGEFFSEFGSFDVAITLPKNYVLAATGDRIETDEEDEFLNNKVIKALELIDNGKYLTNDMAFPPSSNHFKTIRFKQYRVHDFAWFADKRFHVLHDQIQLPNTNKTVDTWAFFTNKHFYLWKDALDYINESTIFYSHMVGDYPYNSVTAIDGVITAGGGMEYPNITVIGEANSRLELDITIAHEVGHNWFYGILGSNERDYPALDEGVNSFYELSYIRAKYPEKKMSDYLGLDTNWNVLGVNKISYWREKEIAYFLSAKSNLDQPIDSKSTDLSDFNYGAIIYCKTAVVLDYVRDYMGDEAFNKAMQFYYENYKFKHPQPKDLLQTLQYFCGNDLSWLSDYLTSTTKKIDYKITNVKRNKDGSYEVKVKNKTKVPVPISLNAYKNGREVGFAWFNGSDSSRTLDFPPSDVDVFKIDGDNYMPDVNRSNNAMRVHGLFRKMKPLQLNFVTKFPDATKMQINYLPVFGYNVYNGSMLGLSLHNYSLYEKKVDFNLAPMYAFQSKTLTGFADINFNFYPRAVFRKVSFGAYAKSFASNSYDKQNLGANGQDYFLNYLKIKPSVSFEFQNKNKVSKARHIVSVAYNMLSSEQLNYTTSSVDQTNYYYKQTNKTAITAVNYDWTDKRVIHPFHVNANLQYDGIMAKFGITYQQNFSISKTKNIEVRIFAGSFLQGNEDQKGAYRFRMNGFTGYQDYLYESNFLGRNEYSGLAFSQFADVDGAFKVWTPLGQSSTYLVTVNLKSPKIWKLPVKVFVDIGTADKNSLNVEQILWDAGLNFTLIEEIVDVYFPLMYSNDIKENLSLNKVSYPNTIRFTFNIHKLKPKDFLRANFL